MAKILNKEPAVYKQEQDNFLRELRKFHDQKGTGFKHIPCINGREIDLYLLYWLVTAQGGWERVNNKNGWDDLLESFEVPASTANGSLALKQTYLRYLDSYEKYYFLGEEEEPEGDGYFDEEDSRLRRQRAQKIVQAVPTTYNEGQHRVQEDQRSQYGLSTDLYKKTDYDRLCLSLLSPLPNEQDFAINVCTLLSNEGRHTLKLSKCPRLLDLLLAHAGVFNHRNLRDYVTDNYDSVRSYDQVKFWHDVCRQKAVLELIYDERNFYAKFGENGDRDKRSDLGDDSESSDGLKRISALKARAKAELDTYDDDDELFACGRGNGTRELTGQRVLQVATVIRNLSFEEDNSSVLAKNLTCLRFVLLCVNSSWANLNQMGFDILSNIASEVILEEPSEDFVTDLLFATLSRCVGAQDRFQVISSLDVLNKLCGLESNEDFIVKLLDQAVYSKLTEYLSLHDIHLLISVLECLYSLTSLGESPCTSLVRTHSAVELLVSLVTVEAQSYGPKACILMRVVETVPGNTNQQPSSSTASTQPSSQPLASSTGATVASTVNPTTLPTPTLMKTPVLPTAPLPQPQVSGMLPRQPLPPAVRPTLPPLPAAAGVQQQVRPLQAPPGSQQVQLRVSNEEPHRVFCLSWLKATYEPCPGKSIEQNIMYKQYLASMHRMGRKEVISATHYAMCIRTLFGGATGPNKKEVPGTDKAESHYTGIQVRAQPLPLKLTPAQAAAAQEASRQQQATQPQQQPQQQQVIQQQQQVVQVQGQPQQNGTTVVQHKIVNAAGQVVHGVHLNSQGQLVNSAGQVVQGGIVKAVNNQGQAVQQVVQQGQQQQVVQGVVQQQVQPVLVKQEASAGQGTIVRQVSPSSQVVLNQAGQVVQQRIVSGSGQIVAQGMLQGGTVVSSGIVQARQGQQAAYPVQGAQPQQVIQRVIQGSGAGAQQGRVLQASQVILQSSAAPGAQQAGGQVIYSSGTGAGVGVRQVVPASTVLRTTTSSQPVSLPAQLSVRPVSRPPPTQEAQQLENGSSPLDGILPKDPGFGKLDSEGLAELLQEKDGLQQPLNGLVQGQQLSKVVHGVQHQHMLNGDTLQGGKRAGPGQGEGVDSGSPAKRQAVEGSVVTNGGLHLSVQGQQGTNGSMNGRSGHPGQAVSVQQQQQGVIVSGGAGPVTGQLVQTSSGQLFLKTTNSAGGAVLVPAVQQRQQQQPAKTVIYIQPDQANQQQVVRQVVVGGGGHPGGAVVRQVVQGGEQQQQPLPQEPVNKLPQLDGAEDSEPCDNGAESESEGEGLVLSQLDGMMPGPGEQGQQSAAVPVNVQQPQPPPVLVQQVANGRVATPPPPSGSPAPSPGPAPAPTATTVKIDTGRPFLCEWANCGKSFRSPKEVEGHCIAEHCSDQGGGNTQDMPCLWARCDGMKRKRFSLMTHLQDRHCHPQLMKLMAVRRVQIAQSGKSEVPLPPAPPPHPGYAPHAAYHAIKRHAVEFANPKELAMRDEKEGPVTKSIRLTASLILRNLVIYSSLGRSRLQAFESHLSTVALSNVESSRTVSQILWEMANAKEHDLAV